MFSKIVSAIFLVGLLAGCAVGNKVDYRAQSVSLNTGSQKAIALGVHDQRPYVLSGNKTPQFVGIQRGGWGNPFDVLTQSGGPLAQDFATSISSALTRSGATVTAKAYPHSDSNDAVTKQLLALTADKYLLVSYQEWKTDSLMNTALIYDITARVLLRDGTVVAQNHLSGRDKISGNVTGDQTRANDTVPAAVSRKLQLLLGDKEIIAALQ
ncbi:MAG TPA: hypothetical protein DD437_05605 [Rhodobiaceae bacterium]|nr:hypothetical protein [Rhodobiaceae bacterium]|tara:strand:- start:6453 stop:7085 length:633 start_codon:yes stop_codon:yes gene_type:complete